MLPALPAAFPDLTDTKLGTHPAPTTAVHLRVLPALPALPDLTDTKLGTHPAPTTAVHLPSAPDLICQSMGVLPCTWRQSL